MGTKITSVQNSKDCGIIFLLRENYAILWICIVFKEVSVCSRGLFLLLWWSTDAIKIGGDSKIAFGAKTAIFGNFSG